VEAGRQVDMSFRDQQGDIQFGNAGKEATMLWTGFVILSILWLLGLITRYSIGWFIHNSYPARYRHRRGDDPSHSGTKTIITIWTLAGQIEVFCREEQLLYKREKSFCSILSLVC
jgi:hypothetical protein